MYRPQDYRTPRTMNEAFHPYAELHVTHPGLLSRFARYIWSMFL